MARTGGRTTLHGTASKKGGGIALGLGALLLIGALTSNKTDTEPAAADSTPSVVTTSEAPPPAAPRQRSSTPQQTSPSSVPPARPAPVLAMTCPVGGTNASPVFGHQITAVAPYTVGIDYGDGDVYTNDDQHLGAIFEHTYQRAGTFLVTARVTDATGQRTTGNCTYSWTAPAPAPAVGGTGGGGGSGGGSDTYTNVDGNQVPGPVEAPAAPPGATAHCVDGTWSFSQNRRGTCSHHGGVAEWL